MKDLFTSSIVTKSSHIVCTTLLVYCLHSCNGNIHSILSPDIVLLLSLHKSLLMENLHIERLPNVHYAFIHFTQTFRRYNRRIQYNKTVIICL
jgi:hypothetical protein